jgi:hypothetical protein
VKIAKRKINKFRDLRLVLYPSEPEFGELTDVSENTRRDRSPNLAMVSSTLVFSRASALVFSSEYKNAVQRVREQNARVIPTTIPAANGCV